MTEHWNWTSRLAASVVAVPPLARDSNGRISTSENRKIIAWLEAAGIRTLLYGGNAVLYHLRPSEFRSLCEMLLEAADPSTWLIPAVGPSFGVMMDQADVLQDLPIPTVMLLPQKEIADQAGIVRGIQAFGAKLGRPIVLYLKHDRWLEPEHVSTLVKDGLISWIKYAVVRDDPMDDRYLRSLIERVEPAMLVSGMGEQPAIAHYRSFGMQSFTSGCVCLAPKRSMQLLAELRSGRYDRAEQIRERFERLEDLRNEIHPIRVLHRAIELAGVAQTGPITPMLSPLEESDDRRVQQAAMELMRWEASHEE